MKHSTHQRILAIAPSTRGFGFAVLEAPDKFVDWGVKTVNKRDKNADSLVKAGALMAHYLPTVLVLENASAPDVRRSARIQTLCTDLAALAKHRKVNLKVLTRTRVRQALLSDDAPGNKQALAEVLAERFPDDLGARVPRKRRLWMSEAYGMGFFDAIALGLVSLTPKGKKASAEDAETVVS